MRCLTTQCAGSVVGVAECWDGVSTPGTPTLASREIFPWPVPTGQTATPIASTKHGSIHFLLCISGHAIIGKLQEMLSKVEFQPQRNINALKAAWRRMAM